MPATVGGRLQSRAAPRQRFEFSPCLSAQPSARPDINRYTVAATAGTNNTNHHPFQPVTSNTTNPITTTATRPHPAARRTSAVRLAARRHRGMTCVPRKAHHPDVPAASVGTTAALAAVLAPLTEDLSVCGIK
ncbi:hypothetical protein [Actinocrispum sp. NPDC049592]|uniref:hypothetical protein n=1 Tax=Actinocrispum sp. NPDC049592 TaxID=3154835 RepID=UPI00343728E6